MRHNNFALALLAGFVLAACGGDDPRPGDQSLRVQYTQQVTFGDSLSDVGTYAVGTVKQLGGGKYTINGDLTAANPALTGKVWVELMAAQLGLPAPCAAQTGLRGNAAQGFSVPVETHATCYNYASGGARVTNPIGPGNAAIGSPLGALTTPVATQVANHLAKSGGTFSGKEIVFVTAGGNDGLALLSALRSGATEAGRAAGDQEGARVGAETYIATLAGLLSAGATDPATTTRLVAASMAREAQRPGSTTDTITSAGIILASIQPGNSAVAEAAVWQPLVARAQAAAQEAGAAAGLAAGQKAAAEYAVANGPALVAQMATAGGELAAIVTTQIVGKGATHVVVNNLPDLGNTPAVRPLDAQTRQLVDNMVQAFNNALKSGLGNSDKVLHVDIFTVNRDQVANPAPYGLTNTTTPACAPNPIGTTSLGCTAGTLVAGDVSHYMFADDVHPTPFLHSLIARYVAEQMTRRGWL